MSYTQTLNQMAELNLNGMLHAYREIADDPTWMEQSFDDKLGYLVHQDMSGESIIG